MTNSLKVKKEINCSSKTLKITLWLLSFFVIFITLRDVIFSLLLATMFEYPLAQTIIITIMSCLMIVYLLFKKPFKSKFDAGQQLFFEIIGLMVNVGVFLNAILDAGEYKALEFRNNLGKLIIVSNMIFNFVTGSFMLYFLVQLLIDFYKDYQQKRAKKLETLKIQSRAQKSPIPYSNSIQQNNTTLQQSSDLDHLASGNSEATFIQQENSDLQLLPPHITPPSHRVQPRRILKSIRPVQREIQLQDSPSSVEDQESHFRKDSISIFCSNKELQSQSSDHKKAKR